MLLTIAQPIVIMIIESTISKIVLVNQNVEQVGNTMSLLQQVRSDHFRGC
jgi:hypothetical protein